VLTSRSTPEYGKEFNPERKKRGVPVIPENWNFLVSSDMVIWSDPDTYWKPDNRWGDKANPEPPIYYQKQVIIQDENTIKEIDAYLGSNVYEIKDDLEFPERVIITCIYYLDAIENITCTADVYTLDVTYTNGDVELAKAILKEWGLSYP
jgi:hypothetical protein